MTTRGAAPNPAATSSVRRNIFQTHLSRRTTASSTSTSASTIHATSFDSSAEIVAKDAKGDYVLHHPPKATIEAAQLENGPARGPENISLDEALKLARREKKNRPDTDHAELLAAVQSSLRTEVASLAEDDWMYEAEEEF